MSNLVDVVAFIGLLGVIIFVHEFGHFLTAKLFGMRVFIFSFGFGKRLWGFEWGNTDCRLSMVPLGGYVKLEGEPEDYLSENTGGAAGDFTARPRWQRFLVYMAGPVMNAVLTVTVMTVSYMIGFGVDTSVFDAPILGVVDPGSPGAEAGLATGDRILAVDGQSQASWQDVDFALALRPDRRIRLRVERAGQQREVELQTQAVKDDNAGRDGLEGMFALVRVGIVVEGSPALAAGVQPNDAILRVGITPIRQFSDISDAVAQSKGQPVVTTLWRDGRILQREIAPRDVGEGPKLGLGPKVVIEKFPFVGAVRAAVHWTWSMTEKTLEVLQGLLTARVSPKSLIGPLGIAKASGEAARLGAGTWFGLMAVISLQVGIMNLFPVAPLDGGHLAILAGEGVVRRDISINAKAWLMNAGALMLLALIGLVLFNDISKTAIFKAIFH